MSNIPTPKADDILKVLQFNANGNVLLTMKGHRHKMVHYYKPSRRSTYNHDFLKINVFLFNIWNDIMLSDNFFVRFTFEFKKKLFRFL